MSKFGKSEPDAHPGLYDPAFEHDGCGVAAVARLDGAMNHEVVVRSLEALDDLEHRGAAGADPSSGDGAGILTGIPDAFIRDHAEEFEISPPQLPEAGRFGVAVCFMPADPARRRELGALIETEVEGRGQTVLGWRTVPIDPAYCGETAAEVAPTVRQLLVAAAPETADTDEFERRLFVIRRAVELSSRRRRAPYPQLLRSHNGAQGHVDRAPARQLLPRPARP